MTQPVKTVVDSQVDDIDDVETTSDVSQNGGSDNSNEGKLSYEEIQAELSKVRREAAEKRVKNKQLDAELAEFRKWKESQMSEAEKTEAKLKAIIEERRADAVEIAQAKFGLEEEDLEFLRGETKEEILASAEKLAKRLGRSKESDESNSSGSPNLFPGTRGKPVGSNKQDPNDFLRMQLRGEA